MTYGVTPGLSVCQDGIVEMPCSDALWDAPTQQQWQNVARTQQSSSTMSVKDAVAVLLYGRSPEGLPEVCWTWSPFATFVAMHAMTTQVWHMTHFWDMSSRFDDTLDPFVAQLSARTEQALSRCRTLLSTARNDQEHTWNDADGPILFNAFAVLRVCYSRAFTDVRVADRSLLLREESSEILSALRDFVAAPQNRDEFTTEAIAKAVEAFHIPIRAGSLLIQKTAALTWSIDHALAGWDSGK